MPSKPLTKVQNQFVEAYLKTGSITEAYLAHHECSRQCAASNGHKILKLPAVQAEIKRRQSKELDKLKISTGYVIKRLHELVENSKTPASVRVRALELLGKHTGAFDDDRLTVTSNQIMIRLDNAPREKEPETIDIN